MSLTPERWWNSWDADRPAAMRFLPLGLDVVPLVYAASSGEISELRGTGQVALGQRSLDAASVSLTIRHAGTELDWTWRRHDPFTLEGGWRVVRHGEWGLRFWVILALRADPQATFYADGVVIRGAFGSRHLAVTARRPPLLVTAHDDLAALCSEYTREGYFTLGSRANTGQLLALRFNLEEAPEQRFVLSFADRPDLASDRAAAVLAQPAPPAVAPLHTGEHAGALDAVRDVIGWNTVWDPINRRPYTALSRNWATSKFGGFGVWLDDVLYHALLAGHLDAGIARENLAAVLGGLTPQGNLPCLLTGRDSWVDRSQPPIAALVVRMLQLRLGARDLAEAWYPTLAANHAWWWAYRDPEGAGLVAYGTSDVGSGLYKGTKLAAKDESSMDNSPVHDELALDAATGCLDGWDVGLNALLCLDAEMLGDLAQVTGRDPAPWRAQVERHRTLIAERLWDGERQVFANRKKGGGFVRSIAPTSFYPLLCAAASPEQATLMVEGWLRDPERFGGRFPLPSVSRDDPAFADNVYWRGRCWPPLSWLTYHGLRRTGFDADATALAGASHSLFMESWRHRVCPENAHADTGAALDQPDTDGFYGWGALWPALAVADRIDVDPWHGLRVRAGGADLRIGPLPTPLGLTVLEIQGGRTTVVADGRTSLETATSGWVDVDPPEPIPATPSRSSARKRREP